MEPLPHAPTNFLSLPREIRDEICEFALLTSPCIVVWSGRWEGTHTYEKVDITSNDIGSIDYDYDIDGDPIVTTGFECHRVLNHIAMASSIQHLALNLLRCNNITVAREAAMTFNSKNTFSFFGDHNWDPIVSWLESIGPQNRSHLTRLDITAQRPPHSWQWRDGTRVTIPNLYDEVYPRSPHLYRSPECTKQGEVESINPIIETMFALLGNRDSKSTLKLHLEEDQAAYYHYFSMDLPNLVEKFRVDYTTKGKDCSPVEVLWMGKTDRHAFNDKRSLIQKRGWEVVETEDMEQPRFSAVVEGWPPLPPMLKVRFTLRKREQLAVLVAEDPSPYSYHGYFDDN